MRSGFYRKDYDDDWNETIVEVKKGEHINKVLKRFKRRVRNSQVLKEYRSRQSFVSNSSKKKDMMNKARYSQYMKDLEIS